ncbi:hypothetical protein L1987_87066 [Smallanthus sonchifolius]|nr:hypothetical protein L1987_87066 [Smallanthus sonchifolius]
MQKPSLTILALTSTKVTECQVTQTLLNFVALFRKAHEENYNRSEQEKKKAQKVVEMEKANGINLKRKARNKLNGIYSLYYPVKGQGVTPSNSTCKVLPRGA